MNRATETWPQPHRLSVDEYWTVAQIAKRLTLAVGDSAEVFSQSALRLGRFSEPQPDVLLLQPRGRAYRKAHPGPADALLVVEVSDTTLRYDRNRKAPLYARYAVPEVG